MNSFNLIYLFYGVKLGSQLSISLIGLVDISSGTIVFIATVVAIFATLPLYHIIVHICTAKPLSNSAFIAYLWFR
jgi:hypothetical protein